MRIRFFCEQRHEKMAVKVGGKTDAWQVGSGETAEVSTKATPARRGTVHTVTGAVEGLIKTVVYDYAAAVNYPDCCRDYLENQ